MTIEEFTKGVADGMIAAGDNSDWYLAIVSAALDEAKGDWESALELANKAYTAQPSPPSSTASFLSTEDVDSIIPMEGNTN